MSDNVMKISDLIDDLEAILEEKGDLDIGYPLESDEGEKLIRPLRHNTVLLFEDIFSLSQEDGLPDGLKNAVIIDFLNETGMVDDYDDYKGSEGLEGEEWKSN